VNEREGSQLPHRHPTIRNNPNLLSVI